MNDPYAQFGRPVDEAPRQPAAPRRQPRPAMPQIRFADDRDAIIRTVLGEAGGEPELGRQAVAAVIQNRARTRGLTPAQVVLERNQFEPWGNPETASRLMAYTPDSPEYQEVARQIDAVLQGYDPTGGASHFYSPSAQAALGRPAPSWDDGSGFEIGRHRFFRLEGQPGAQQADPFAAYGRPVEDEGAAVEMASAYGQSSPEIGEVAVDRGVVNVNGRAVERGGGQPDRDLGPWEQYQAGLRQSREERIARLEREQNPQYQAEYEAALARSENVPALLENLVQGGTLGAVPMIEGALGWLDPNVEGIDRGLASQAARDASRDRQAALLREDPVGTIGAQLAGGLLTPGLKGTGEWIGAARGVERGGRAAAVGAGYGFGAGVIGGEGDLGERAPQALLGAGVGAASAGLLDMGAQRAAATAAKRAANPSHQRRLSRQGVDLTLGQMLQPTPVIGGMIRGAEDGISSVPFVGAAVQGARNQGIESLNRVAVNRALAPIGAVLPDNVTTGYEAVRHAQQTLGRAYDEVLPQITAQIDDQFRADIDTILRQADAELPSDLAGRVRSLVGGDRVLARASGGDTFTGDEFKKIENTLRTLTERYARSQDVDQQAVADLLVDTRTAFTEMLARSNPEQAAQLRAINTGWANLSRVQKAAGGTAALGRDGQFTPGELGIAALQGATNGARGRGDALMQDLARDAKAVLPNTIGDSGTATRGALTGLLGLIATGTFNPALGAPVIAAGIAYSKPAQAALNAIYRATDRQTAGSALSELQKLAGRNPALQPYYADAARHVLRAFQSQEQGQEPRARGLLSPTPPAQAVP